MIKGIVLCFIFLFAQLIVLHYIDGRVQSGSKDARQVIASATTVQRDEKEHDQDARA